MIEYSCDRIVIVITADKGEMYRFGKITFEGNTLFCDEEIMEQFRIAEGKPYSPDRLRESMLKIVDLYGKFGYIDANADFEPTLNSDCPIYDIHLTIDEGDEYRVGLIKVFGNCSTQNCVILHECLLIPGEVFNILRLKKTEERLRNVGYFKTVNVYAVRCDDSSIFGSNYRDVHIEVEETNTGNFSAFGGFSNVESVFGGFSISEKNFNYRGLSKVFTEGYSAVRGGGEYAYFNTTIGNKSRNYIFSWSKPYFHDTNWIVGFDIEKSNIRYISNDYSFDAFGFTLHAKYPINDYMRLGWHYRFKDTQVHVTEAGDLNPLLLADAKNDGLVAAMGVAFAYDSTDHPRKPTCGHRSRIEAEYAGLGGHYNFLGLAYINTWYYTLSKKRCSNAGWIINF